MKLPDLRRVWHEPKFRSQLPQPEIGDRVRWSRKVIPGRTQVYGTVVKKQGAGKVKVLFDGEHEPFSVYIASLDFGARLNRMPGGGTATVSTEGKS